MLCGCQWWTLFRLILIVKDILQPVVVQSDIHGRYIVVDINYEGQRIWIVGIYAPNEVAQRIELWRRLNEVLRNGNPGFLLGDFNMCSEMGQSTLMHSLMDAPKRVAWDLFAIEVLKCDAWLWINGQILDILFNPRNSDQHGVGWIVYI